MLSKSEIVDMLILCTVDFQKSVEIPDERTQSNKHLQTYFTTRYNYFSNY